jgi:phosphoribosylglycinamide formyltransferase-1
MSDPYFLRKRFVILISGQGSNMEKIVESCLADRCPADVLAVISNQSASTGLKWARDRGITTRVVSHTDFSSRNAFDAALMLAIDQFYPDYVLLAGFMRVLTPEFVQHYAGKLVNIHPSLLPAFPGLHTHAQAIAKGVQAHGCTVHFVTPVLDHGPIIAQGVVPVLSEDTPESLAKRVLVLEHVVYPQVAIWLAQGRVHVIPDQRVNVDAIHSRIFVSEQSV